MNQNQRHWLTVGAFALAMAWVESAVVYYLRTHIDRIEPYQADPLPIIGDLGPVELVRELATMVMLFTVGMLAGKTWRARWGYAVLGFGLWDIFYYVFLKVMCGWPHSIFDWDILFLIPLPWWGPVIAPVLIAALMIIWGTLNTQFEVREESSRRAVLGWLLSFLGTGLALFVFMQDTLRVAGQGTGVIRRVLPTEFNWPLFLIAFALMSVPVLRQLHTLRRQVAPNLKPTVFPQSADCA